LGWVNLGNSERKDVFSHLKNVPPIDTFHTLHMLCISLDLPLVLLLV
jgi:hypothetical protein